MAKAVHASQNTNDGSIHAVGVGELRVMIICDGPSEWYAQGLEINYIAQGTDLENVQRSFERGLKATIEEHLKLHGNIRQLLHPAPPDVWAEFFEHATSEGYQFSQVSSHELDQPTNESLFVATTDRAVAANVKHAKAKSLPFKRISYLSQCQA